MSTDKECRREEVGTCQPDRTILVKKPKEPPVAVEPPPEMATMSERQFLRSHTMYSAISSWLFAIAGATNIGVLCAFAGKVLGAAEQGKPLKEALSNKKYNRIALGMMAFGGVCMAVSNYLESKKVVTEWQLGAGKLQRKVAGAERQNVAASSDQNVPAPAAEPKNWVDAVQPKTTVDRVANCFRPG